MPRATISDQILKFVGAKGYQPRKLAEVARALGLGADELGEFHDAVKALMRSGRVVLGSRNVLLPTEVPDRIIGQFRRNPRGFGFIVPVEPSAHGDLYVPAGAAGDAITGDTVAAEVVRRRRGPRDRVLEGRIVAIIQRGQSRFVGELVQAQRHWVVIPDGNTLHVPIVVGDPGAKGGRSGDQVVVEIVKYPTERSDARGVIVKVLGKRGEPEVETVSIIEQYQLPQEFAAAALHDARRAVDDYDAEHAAAGREDLRKLTIITIDPVDARDFDDAISLTRHANGWELGVHIADVAHFVPEGSALDTEARERATSVYLPRMVIPMLPEVLSNGVCSLQEREARLTKSVFISYDRHGNVQATRFANSIIRSTKRLTYEQASEALDGKTGRMSAKVVALLKDMEQLARVIQKRREAAGTLDFDLPEVELIFDGDGTVVDVRPEDRSYSHKIIEMFMVEANEAVARLLVGLDVPHLRRIHEPPDESALEQLREFLQVFGVKLPETVDCFALRECLLSVQHRPDASAIHLAILRAMKRAEYAPREVGHFGLGSEDYLHFTSPIRRYPDLTAHRLLQRYLDGRLSRSVGHDEAPPHEELVALGKHCSTNERRAEAAERELTLVLLLRMLEGRVGEEFDGTVTGIVNMGLFIQLDRVLVDGLLRFESLPEDWWEVEPQRGGVVGERSGVRIRMGDRLRVAIARVNVAGRTLDLALAGPLPAGGKRTTGERPLAAKKRRGHAQIRKRGKKGGRRGRRAFR